LTRSSFLRAPFSTSYFSPMTKRKNIWQQTIYLSIMQLQLRWNFPVKRTGRQLRPTNQTSFFKVHILVFLCTRKTRRFLIIFVLLPSNAYIFRQAHSTAQHRADDSLVYPTVYDYDRIGRPGRFSSSTVAWIPHAATRLPK
jgi:hypothetical protein